MPASVSYAVIVAVEITFVQFLIFQLRFADVFVRGSACDFFAARRSLIGHHLEDNEYQSDAFATEGIVCDGQGPASQLQPQMESHSMFDEIYSYLWPFYSKSEPKTLQDIGFQINPPPEMMYLFLHSPSGNERGLQPRPSHQLPRRDVSEISHLHTGNSRNMISHASFMSRFEPMSYTQRK